MSINRRSRHSPAWYSSTREEFLKASTEDIADKLNGRAGDENLDIESAQRDEWRKSVDLLQKNLGERIPLLRQALAAPGCEAIHDVILEFDFHRRGLRMDCLLLGDGVLFVIEFKRSKIQSADRDQVVNYAVNLLEFHKVTQEWCGNSGAIVVPILALTESKSKSILKWGGLFGHSWPSLAHKPLECDSRNLQEALQIGLQNRRTSVAVALDDWLGSTFCPSSSILDATLSLYGNHDVVAIQEHAAPKEAIEASVNEIRCRIDEELNQGHYHIVFLSGAPGAGKTLVGLDIAMRGSSAKSAVFVTGNTPLVDVLHEALGKSYYKQSRNAKVWIPKGYCRSDSKFIAKNANFKIVKAHHFLGQRDIPHKQEDGRVLIFDEAQRTYKKDFMVIRTKLPDHEANLILKAQEFAFPQGGSVVVALVGHQQAIGPAERGIVAWLEAADSRGWSFSISDVTLSLSELHDREKWATHLSRRPLQNGHLHQSMRYYRNAKAEDWVAAVLDGDVSKANSCSEELVKNGNTILLTRCLNDARKWARSRTIGGQRSGLIASGQGRRLAAEGLFVSLKPDIAAWMLAPSSDIQSSNALETVQNQYQIQGLEIDFPIVCWDADLRRDGGDWTAYKLHGSDWRKDKCLDVAKNGYRVLLTRARQGMVIFVPQGDTSGEDVTRNIEFYDGVWKFLKECGAQDLKI